MIREIDDRLPRRSRLPPPNVDGRRATHVETRLRPAETSQKLGGLSGRAYRCPPGLILPRVYRFGLFSSADWGTISASPEEGGRQMTTLLVGLVADVGEMYVVVGKTRIELCEGQALAPFQVGFSVAVIADAVGGRFIDGSLVTPLA
jgi:hypothetical protein